MKRDDRPWQVRLLERSEEGPEVRPGLGPCRLWTGTKCRDGYGNFRLDGKTVSTHRLGWMLEHGEIPEGMSVLHRCDVRSCFLGAHLFLGTQKDNMSDASRKGRMAKGEGFGKGRRGLVGLENHKAKLTEEQVYEIRECREKQVDAAARYGVTQALISSIRRRASWAHLPERVSAIAPGDFRARTLTDDQVYEIRSSSELATVLARRIGVTPTTVRRVRAREIWKHLPERPVNTNAHADSAETKVAC